jgi:hypothetical protein
MVQNVDENQFTVVPDGSLGRFCSLWTNMILQSTSIYTDIAVKGSGVHLYRYVKGIDSHYYIFTKLTLSVNTLY